MSEYYLADQRARERTKQRTQQDEAPAGRQIQEAKVTLLGDFMYRNEDSPGFDPYNNVHGKSPRDTWRTSRDRR